MKRNLLTGLFAHCASCVCLCVTLIRIPQLPREEEDGWDVFYETVLIPAGQPQSNPDVYSGRAHTVW